MNHVFDSARLPYRTTAEQHTRYAEIARTEAMLACDLGIDRWKLRLMRWAGCAPRATRFERTVYYTFEDIAEWLRPFR